MSLEEKSEQQDSGDFDGSLVDEREGSENLDEEVEEEEEEEELPE